MGRLTVHRGSFSPYEPETIAYMTAIGIPNDGSSTIYTGKTGSDIWTGLDNNIVALKVALGLTLKVNNLSTKFKFIYPRIGGTASTHRYNLVTALQDGTYNGGFTHDATGSVGNGSTGYFDCGFLYPSAFNMNSFSTGFISKTNNDGLYNDIGLTTGGYANALIYGKVSNQLRTRCNGNTGNFGIASASSVGMKSVSRTSSTEFKVYENGTLVQTNTDTSYTTTPVNYSFTEFAHNGYGSIIQYSPRLHTFSFCGVGFNGTEINALYTAFNNIDTLLGR